MKVTTGTFLGGLPALDEYHINITKGVNLHLSADQYVELGLSMGSKLSESIVLVQKQFDKISERSDVMYKFITDMRDLFYEEFGDNLIKRDIKDIELKKFDEILTRADSILELE